MLKVTRILVHNNRVVLTAIEQALYIALTEKKAFNKSSNHSLQFYLREKFIFN